MSYNYGKEVRKLEIRQAAEDAKLREAGVSEFFIEILHKMNLADLKANRVFYTHNVQSIEDIFDVASHVEYFDEGIEDTVDTIEALLNMVDNPVLHQLLMDTDKLTLQMLLLKMQGYSVDEIAVEINMNTDAIYKRLSRIKKKIKQTLA